MKINFPATSDGNGTPTSFFTFFIQRLRKSPKGSSVFTHKRTSIYAFASEYLRRSGWCLGFLELGYSTNDGVTGRTALASNKSVKQLS